MNYIRLSNFDEKSLDKILLKWYIYVIAINLNNILSKMLHWYFYPYYIEQLSFY